MGSPQIRNRATLGGNIGNASPAADMVCALAVDGTRAVIRSANGEQTVDLRHVIVGPGQTSLKPGDVIVDLIVPKPPQRSYCRFDKLGYPVRIAAQRMRIEPVRGGR